MNQKPEHDNEFDLDATEQELLDEFGLLVAAEYYYKTSMSTAAKPLTEDFVPAKEGAVTQKEVDNSLDQRMTDAIERQKDLLKD